MGRARRTHHGPGEPICAAAAACRALGAAVSVHGEWMVADFKTWCLETHRVYAPLGAREVPRCARAMKVGRGGRPPCRS